MSTHAKDEQSNSGFTICRLHSLSPHWYSDSLERTRFWHYQAAESYVGSLKAMAYAGEENQKEPSSWRVLHQHVPPLLTAEQQEAGKQQGDGRRPARPRPDRMNPVFLEVLKGTVDPNCALSLLDGQTLVLEQIFNDLKAFWRSCIKQGGVYASIVGRIRFPVYRGIRINMMPIILGDIESIPLEYRHYIPLIFACPVSRSEWGAPAYLTVDERVVEVDGSSHRRSGLHVESPSIPYLAERPKWKKMNWSQPLTLAWGRGAYDMNDEFGEFSGGIYMGSNVANSCRVWNCKITTDDDDNNNNNNSTVSLTDDIATTTSTSTTTTTSSSSSSTATATNATAAATTNSSDATPTLSTTHRAITGHLGDLEHLRAVLGPGVCLDADQLCWITDRTPHESLPLPAGTRRQFFRLVTGPVSVWYSRHNTANHLGVQPGQWGDGYYISDDRRFAPPVICHEDKFTVTADGRIVDSVPETS